MPRRAFGVLAASAALVLTVAACSSSGGKSGGSNNSSGSTGGASASTSDKSPIIVGSVAPLTGAYSAPGTFSVAGLKAAVAYLNDNGGILGRKIELESEDSGGNPVQSVAAMKLLTSKHVNVVFGDLLSGYAAMVPLFTKDNVISMSSSTDDDLWDTASANPNGFSDFIPTKAYAEIYIDYLTSHYHVTKIGVIGGTDSFGTSLTAAVKTYAATKNISVVTQQFSPSATDLTTQMRSLKDAGADALISATFSSGQILSIKAQQALNWDPPAVTSNTLNDSAGVAAVKASGLKNLVGGPVSTFMLNKNGVTTETDKQKVFLSYLQKAYGSGSLDGVWSTGVDWFDGLLIWASAVQKAGTTDTAAVKKVMESGTPLTGYSGDFSYSTTSHVTPNVDTIFGLYAGGVSCPGPCPEATG